MTSQIYAQHVNRRKTPQSEKALPEQVENSAGGFVFAVDVWTRLDRFLILGNEGGTYYASEKKLTRENAACVDACLAADGPRTVSVIAAVSQAGRAPKNDPAIFALALATGHPNKQTRAAALAAIPLVCRTGTHLFQFLQTVKNFRGWGRGLREAVCKWYIDRKPDDLAYQVLKYQQRGGMSHRDVLRLAGGAISGHKLEESQKAVLRYVAAGPSYGTRTVARKGREPVTYDAIDAESVPKILDAYERVKASDTATDVVRLILEHNLSHEMVPNQWKNDPAVWEALLQRMPITATIRNLGKLSAVGVLSPMSDAVKTVVDRIGNLDLLRRGRVHPLSILVALNTYTQGHGERGKLTWSPAAPIIDVLNAAFYTSFLAIEPTGKKRLIALDVSGSMDGGTIAGMVGVTPRVASVAMAMTTVRSEANYHAIAFTSGGRLRGDSGIKELALSKSARLDHLCAEMGQIPFGGTDCALPMLWAADNRVEVDAVEIYTDSETWAGRIHPHQALEKYRQKMGRDCKLIIVGMTATEFSIANPNDRGMLDVVGFDTGAPTVMADFIRGTF